MEEEKSAQPEALPEEVSLEFRPWVKWCGMGLAAAGSIGFFLGTYYVGYHQGEESGYTAASSSGVVQRSLNEAALKNVLSFMRLSTSSDEHLLKTAENTDAAFGWIVDSEVRMEAEWSLVQTLLMRGKSEAAHSILIPLLERVPQSEDWAHRALFAGAALISAGHHAPAGACLRQAEKIFASCKQVAGQQEALGQLIALEMCVPRSAEETMAALKKLVEELQSDDEGYRQLRAAVLVHMGTLYRAAGQAELAERTYREALGAAENLRTVRPEGALSKGAALLELGDAAAAESLLRMAAENPGTSLSDIYSRVLAWRYLAVVEQQRGHYVTALALLHRAQGMAEGRVQQGNAFWPCLYDQRGWMHFMVQNYQTALLDFNAACAATQDARLLMQPQEGAARCYLELGKSEEALPLLEKCLQLRAQLAPEDKNAIGRLNLLLGQLYDQQGKVAEAEAAYKLAVQNLSGDAPDEVNNRREALLGHAYVLTELKRWAEAYAAWEQVLPLVDDQFDRREEARTQMRLIKPHISSAPPAETPPQG